MPPAKFKRGPSAVDIALDEDSLKRLKRGMRAVGETDSPAFREGMNDVGHKLTSHVAQRASGSMGTHVEYVGLNKGGLTNVKALGVVRDPRAKPREFGRQYWYRGYKRGGKGSQKRGQRFKSSPGQPERPFVGIKTGDQAIGETEPYARARLMQAIAEAWEGLEGAD